jgi:hypothetical protein
MFRDPLYREIRRKLRELSDGNAFELCANDLLQKIYPSLSPREGGDDAGLDGLITDRERSIQLICTTGQDVLGNLSRSIESNLKQGGTSHACILATSRRLTNSAKRKLGGRAGELGRPLMQIFDQAGMAQLLYRDPRWLKELLGLTGDPPSLSVFPITTRPLLDVPPIGRADDLAKILTHVGDFVLVGQPGSGKTHLLFTVAKRAKGRFVVDEDLTSIANDVRRLEPKLLIVDDAHSRLELLKKLKHLRQTIGADYRIVANCWPGQTEAVCAALQIAPAKSHMLDGLPQKQIKEVIQSQRIFGPDELVAEIIHQSQGKPGLAVTLSRLCWETGTRDVILGTALSRDVRQSFEPLLGEAATHALGCFSLGGSVGLTLETVADMVGRSVFEVKRLVEQLAAAGVLDVDTQNRISVHPFRLRQALVRDVFLKPPVMDLGPLLAKTPDFAATTRILIQAKAIGGNVSDALLRGRLQQLNPSGDTEPFKDYVHLGRAECEWVLDNFPSKLGAVAPITLHANPEKTLTMLLDAALKSQTERAKQEHFVRIEEPLPEVKRWISSAKPGEPDAIERREVLARTLAKWSAANKEPRISIPAALLVLSIEHEDNSSPPGEPMMVVLHRGVVSQDQLSGIASLWPIIRTILRDADMSQGSSISHAFHAWIHPGSHGGHVPNEYSNQSRDHARQMIEELLRDFPESWTLHYHLRRYAEEVGLAEQVVTHPIAEILFPTRKLNDWDEEEKQLNAGADEFAVRLSGRDPSSVIEMLNTVEGQARAASIPELSLAGRVCYRIAESTREPTTWITALLEREAPPHFAEPFFKKSVETNPAESETWVLRALQQAQLRPLGVYLAVRHYAVGDPVWAQASPFFKECSEMIGAFVRRKELSEENVVALLRFSEASVAQSVAMSLWKANSTHRIPDDLLEQWRNVIVDCEDDRHGHGLQAIFRQFPDVAFRWIAKRLDEVRAGVRQHWFVSRHDRAVRVAVEVITQEQRKTLIGKLTKSYAVSDLVRVLIGRDLELYQYLLEQPDLENLRLNPLRLGPYSDEFAYKIDERWTAMVLAALEKGFSPEQIFWESQGSGGSWSGPTSGMYATKLKAYEELLKNPDTRLQQIGRTAAAYFSKMRDENLALEKRAAIRGEIY